MKNQLTKPEVYECCRTHLNQKIENLESELDKVRESAIAETKSSMGDKYETSREMMMQERNRLGKQFDLLKDQLGALESIDADKSYSSVRHGSLVHTDKSVFFICSAIGQVDVNGQKVFAISGNAPITTEMEEKKEGDSFSFNGVDHTIKKIQ